MVLEWVTNWVNKFVIVFILLLPYNGAYAQIEVTEASTLAEELTTESIEINEEINIKFMNKLSLEEFLSDIELSSSILNENQKTALLNHIKNTGDIIDLLELQSLPEFNYSIYQSLLSFIKIQKSNKIKTDEYIKITNRSLHQNDIDKNSLGSHWGMYQQVTCQFKQGTKIGLAREFDVGENTSKSILNQYDHYAWFINHKKRNMELNLGNFQVFHGLGLLVGQGFSGAFGQGGINNIVQNRWRGLANQLEYNTFSGAYLIQQVSNFRLSFGFSLQSIDSSNTFGIHRTESQRNAKDKIKEKLFLSSIDYNTRKIKTSILLLSSIQTKVPSISISKQFFLGSTTLFSELAIKKTSFAYSIGFSRIINKYVQLHLAYTSFNPTYESEYAIHTVQGITKSNRNGIIFHINYLSQRKWNILLTYKATSKEFANNKSLGTNSDVSNNLRIDKTFRSKNKWSMLFYTRNKEIEGNENNEFTKNDREYRARTGMTYFINDRVQQDLFYYQSRVNKIHSSALAYQLSIKTRLIKCTYAISLQEINKGVPIYISNLSLIQGRMTQAVYEDGSMQQWGLSIQANRFSIQFQYVQLSKIPSKEQQNKLLIQIKYP